MQANFRPFRCLYLVGLVIVGYYLVGWDGACLVGAASLDLTWTRQ